MHFTSDATIVQHAVRPAPHQRGCQRRLSAIPQSSPSCPPLPRYWLSVSRRLFCSVVLSLTRCNSNIHRPLLMPPPSDVLIGDLRTHWDTFFASVSTSLYVPVYNQATHLVLLFLVPCSHHCRPSGMCIASPTPNVWTPILAPWLSGPRCSMP